MRPASPLLTSWGSAKAANMAMVGVFAATTDYLMESRRFYDFVDRNPAVGQVGLFRARP